MLEEPKNQTKEQNPVPSASLNASRTEQTQELVYILKRDFREVDHWIPGRTTRTPVPGRGNPQHDLKLYESWLAEAHDYFRKASHQKLSLTFTSEWVLDNYYIIRQTLHQIEED